MTAGIVALDSQHWSSKSDKSVFHWPELTAKERGVLDNFRYWAVIYYFKVKVNILMLLHVFHT